MVVGIPNPNLSEVVKAYVALKPDHTWTPEGVVDYLRPELASFKLPRCVEFVAEVPRSVSGKALRRLLDDEDSSRSGLTSIELAAHCLGVVRGGATVSPASASTRGGWPRRPDGWEPRLL